ncbi:myristylated membrane protein A [Lymphocystis disease virus 4]|uniref:Myristylated membrane protein A n=1 Tax=Lymphocystis disease virus 4 TaxID=2704413 RepID=A0A6B9XJU6_9VIRU|nr:myristylated membrane protein A [Lymphocystis disease virus 4]QHR78455.1 myristylated membrane protein A [Lymphocystis disease virus 4]
MGASISKNISNIVTDAYVQVSSEIIKTQVTDINNSQIVTVSDVDGDVNVSDVYFVQQIDVNVKSLMNVLSQQKAQQELFETIAQNAKSVTSGLNAAQYAYAVNQVSAVTTACVQAAVRIEDSCSLVDAMTQEIVLQNIGGSVKIKDLNLSQIQRVFQDCAQDAVSQNETVQHVTEQINQKASAVSSGMSFLIAAAVVIGAVAFAGVQFLAPICLVGGCIGLYYYYNYYDLNYDGYVEELSDDLKKEALTETDLSLNEAVEKLKQTEYTAVYWKCYNLKKNFYVETKPTEIWYLKKIPESLNKDKGIYALYPRFLQGYGSPSSPQIKTDPQSGDFYLDQDTGSYYKYDGEWVEFNKIDKLAEWGYDSPSENPRSPEDLYGQFMGPSVLKLYAYVDNKWIEKEKVNTGVKSYKSIGTPNTLVTKKYYKYVLYASLVLITIGITLSVYQLYKNNESSEL